MIISVILAAVVVLLISIIVGFIVWRKLKRPAFEISAVNLDSINVIKGDIVREEKLGSGNFGDVYRGKWNGLPVALKSMKNEDHVADFGREAAVLEYE